MRYFYCFILVIISPCVAHAQQWSNPENAELTKSMTNLMVNFGIAGMQVSQPSATNNTNQYLDYQNGYYQELQNSLTRAEIYFQKRQTNMYYRELEVIQKRELKNLKRYDQLTIPELNRIFGRDIRN
jgi:hypothetical protein